MKMMDKIWITGASGRLGTALNDLLDCRDWEILDTDSDDVDVTNMQDVLGFVTRNHPYAIINCAGMTDVLSCESNPEMAFRVNALGARNLSIAALKVSARMIQISTDDVFDGTSIQPYTEFDLPSPSSAYGRSKLAGENFVREFAPRHIIIRSAWVYSGENDFLSWLLKQADSNQPILIPNDQYSSPTSAKELANLVLALLPSSEYGLYHGACIGGCSRYEFACEALRLAGKSAELVPTPAAQIPDMFHCAYNTVLDDMMLRLSGVYKLPSWQRALADYFAQRKK